MKRATFIVSDAYLSNAIFDLSNPRLNRDNTLRPFWLLREKLGEHGIELATQDIFPPESSDIVICNEIPHLDVGGLGNAPKILLIFESEVIRPDNWTPANHQDFDVVFTWNDRLVDGQKYLKFNFPQTVPEDVVKVCRSPRESLCVMIAGNKFQSHPLELYSARRAAIEWFESFHPDDFDLYGFGWDQKTFRGSKLFRSFNRIQTIRRLFAEPRRSYRGQVPAKQQTLSHYKFAICYENARDIPGYITEKIFDCLCAGAVPIYWGAPNIADHIPQDCYICRENFSDYPELYEYIERMSEEARMQYVESGLKFLHGAKMQAFTAETFADSIVSAALGLLKKQERH